MSSKMYRHDEIYLCCWRSWNNIITNIKSWMLIPKHHHKCAAWCSIYYRWDTLSTLIITQYKCSSILSTIIKLKYRLEPEMDIIWLFSDLYNAWAIGEGTIGSSRLTKQKITGTVSNWLKNIYTNSKMLSTDKIYCSLNSLH